MSAICWCCSGSVQPVPPVWLLQCSSLLWLTMPIAVTMVSVSNVCRLWSHNLSQLTYTWSSHTKHPLFHITCLGSSTGSLSDTSQTAMPQYYTTEWSINVMGGGRSSTPTISMPSPLLIFRHHHSIIVNAMSNTTSAIKQYNNEI